MKKYLLPAVLILAFGCNSADHSEHTTNDSTTTNGDSTKMTHDTMSKMNTSATVPALPAIPEGAKVMFKDLPNNKSVTSPLKVDMIVEKMKVDSAGPIRAESGHFHIFIDAEDFLPENQTVPTDSAHLHYGKAQTSVLLPLTKGKHKLTLQFADGLHRSYGSKMAATVTVNVK
jgi:hypothetical protein